METNVEWAFFVLGKWGNPVCPPDCNRWCGIAQISNSGYPRIGIFDFFFYNGARHNLLVRLSRHRWRLQFAEVRVPKVTMRYTLTTFLTFLLVIGSRFLRGKTCCEWICLADFWYSNSAVGGVFLVATFWQSLVKNDFRKISVVKIGRTN